MQHELTQDSTLFKDIKEGDLFLLETSLYMKIKTVQITTIAFGKGDTGNAICLSEKKRGTFLFIAPDRKIKHVEVEDTIKLKVV